MSEPEPNPSPTPRPKVRPPFVVALLVVIVVGVLGGAYALGRRQASPSFGAAESAALQELLDLGESGHDASIAGVVQTDDDRLRLAMVMQQTLAAQVSTISFALLLQTDEATIEADPPRIFDESTWSDRSQPERDAAFRRECTEWADRISTSSTAAMDDVDERLRELLAQFAREADDLVELCRS